MKMLRTSNVQMNLDGLSQIILCNNKSFLNVNSLYLVNARGKHKNSTIMENAHQQIFKEFPD